MDTIIDNEDKALKLSFAEGKYDEQEDYIYEQLQEKAEILDTLKEIYSWFALQDILKGEKTVASAMVKKYEKHKKDLKILECSMHLPRKKGFSFKDAKEEKNI